MKKVLTIITLVALATSASAQLFTNLLPGGDFENLTATVTNADASSGSYIISYPTTRGNPDGAGVIEDTTAGGWAVIVLGNTTNTGPSGAPVDDAYSYANLGLVGGQDYTFQIDMRYDTNPPFVGLAKGGFKVEFWNQTDNQGTKIQTSDLRFTATDTNWFLASTNVTVPANKTHFKFVPLLVDTDPGPVLTKVWFDNASIVAPAIPIFAEIAGPPDGSTVGTNYFIQASAGTFPGSVTNVLFYDGATLLGNDTNGPFSLAVLGATPGSAALYCVAEGQDALGGFLSATSATNNVTISSVIPENKFYLDPENDWLGFTTGWSPSGVDRSLQTAALPGQLWGLNDLQGGFSATTSNTIATVGPLTVADTNNFWFDDTGFYPIAPAAGAVGVLDMESLFYSQPGGVSGTIVTFEGTNISETISTNVNLAMIGWTCEAFIKDIPADSGLETLEVSVTITNGQPFSLSLATVPGLDRTVQYGIRTTGPNVTPVDADAYGSAVFISAPLPPPTNVFVDINNPAWGAFYNNATNVSGVYDGANFAFGGPYSFEWISAEWAGCDLVLSPLINDDTNWFVGEVGGTGAISKYVTEANTFVTDSSLVGETIVFSGTVKSTGLFSSVGPDATTGWSGEIFIKDFDAGFQNPIVVSTPLVDGAFSITNVTLPQAGREIQYGFAIYGPPVWVTDGDLYGTVNIENIGLTTQMLTATLNGANIDLSYYGQTGFNYEVQYKDNLDDVSWSNLSGPTAGTCADVTVSDPTVNPDRYYRLVVTP